MLIQNQQLLDQLKLEIATEFGVNLGAETTSRANGSVGGEMTKRLIQLGQQKLLEMNNQPVTSIVSQTEHQHQLH
ncbi:alpha/beta-type small acid-soluble spore protein [Metabacillus arenae]|uniref:Alpha/beta-type small acid-soluble spore protein n=1 Tax=Metabacillus arenae TaxID=2771434 RepID=A0A926NDF7_9BACI|nr:alpha/beta-type small acid-soluble spore protein [Metabacillus arenae]MBD1379120.1 alpha/beta-type small acid-soluble spore protein [Metabacillus arenae]